MGPPKGEGDRLPAEAHDRPALSLVRRLAQIGGSPDKSLGQHFLVSDRVVEAIVKASHGFSGIMEVGPGPGVLTQPLSRAHPLVALELDPLMARASQEAAPEARVVQGDALLADWTSLLMELPEPRGIVSNMPYNITGPLLGRTAEQADLIAGAVLMMQEEVAARIMAPAGARERGFLSVWLQALFEIRRLVSVPPGCFSPPPKVDSAVLTFVPRPGPRPSPGLLSMVKQGFRHPRKTLANCLAPAPAAPALERLGLSPTIRPHQLSWDEWQALHRLLEP